ncbi:MAG: helix-turn-helix domain-containing protein, partial [Anaeroplasmataceae bacterium]|nr:helix-turn-helix domain-containing protein [Anaeroplasmataceae bacterium]
MYYQANDQELLYLIKDGNQQAYQALYSKYEHLIAKLYKSCSNYRKTVYDDFKQECLMCLEKAIHSYQDKYNCSFYSFFLLLIQRNTSKLLRKNSLFLQEKNVC